MGKTSGQAAGRRSPWWREWWFILLVVLVVMLIALLCMRQCGCCERVVVPEAPVAPEAPKVEAVAPPVEEAPREEPKEEPRKEIAFDLSKLRPVPWGIAANGYVEDAATFSKRFEDMVAIAREKQADEVEFPVAAVRYDLRGYDLSKVEQELVSAVAAAFRRTSQEGKLLVEGYTCNVGSDEYNEKLSRRRAERVGSILKGAGIAEDKVEVKWYGETKYGTLPGVNGLEANRRVTVTVVK